MGAFGFQRSLTSTGVHLWKRAYARFLVTLLLAVAILPAALCAEQTEADALVARRIEEQVRPGQADRRFTCRGEPICGIALIPGFYAARRFEPVWSTPRGPVPQALALLAEISRVDEEGLAPRDYHADRLPALATLLAYGGSGDRPGAAQLRADFDLLMTDAAFLLASHRLGGRVNPEAVHASWSAFDHDVDLVRLLNDRLRRQHPTPFLQDLQPPFAGYAALRRVLAEYRRLAQAGGWPRLEDGPPLARSDEGPAVARLRERLLISGDLAAMPILRPQYFDVQLETAVKTFQHRHGLETDGRVARETRKALNVPVERRLQQILANLERWRWMPEDLGPRYLAVNIADFSMTMVDAGRVRDTMRVVVGRTYRKTPVFSGTMTYLEFNPLWNVPRRLAIEDILPRIRKDPGYIARQGIRIFSGWSDEAVPLSPREVDWASLNKDHFPIRLQQAPGPHNALGRIKFMFPNKHAVYLHDTPSREQFDAVSRSFSSGCIRVEDPARLAAFVLEGTAGWDGAAVAKNLGGGERRVVRLARPIPVHLLYWTAWADSEGTVFFREDIYERDAPLLRALTERPTAEVYGAAGRLPGANPADVDVDEIGFGIVADPSPGER